MEELLNKLIEKGWKPFGEERITKINRCEQYAGHWNWGCWSDKNSYWRWKCTRELVSKESGLWQFVCENDYWVCKDTYFVEKYTDHIAIHLYQCNDYRYWLLGSALKDESELEEFLLDNIKIDE